MERIKQAVNRDKRLIIGLYSLILVIGMILLFMFFNKNIIMVIFGSFVTILGVFMVFKHFRSYIKEEVPLLDLLEKEPHKIVWVYSIVTQRMPFGFQINQSGAMYFKMIDGTEIILTLPASELKSVAEILNTKLPHATFGYTKEREQWYIAHPGLLVKGEEEDNEGMKE